MVPQWGLEVYHDGGGGDGSEESGGPDPTQRHTCDPLRRCGARNAVGPAAEGVLSDALQQLLSREMHTATPV